MPIPIASPTMPPFWTIFFACLATAAEIAVVISGVWLALRPRVNAFVRYAPLATLSAWLAAGLVHFAVEGLASILVIPICCFGVFVAARLLWHRSWLTGIHAAGSLIFWPTLLFVSCRYLLLVHGIL